jgi:hypothetical protein
MESVYIINYLNYNNRIFKKPLETQSEYIANGYCYYEEKCSFNMNNQIYTTFTAGRANNAYKGGGNYLIVCNWEDESVYSHWFIINKVKNRSGQWVLSLKRDTIADYYDDFIKSIANIKRGYVDTSNKLIYNNENFNLNQIKQSEDLLKDETGCSWIVGYYTEQSNGTDSFPLTVNTNTNQIETVTYDDTYENFVSDFQTMTTSVGLRYYDEDGNVIGYNPNVYYVIKYRQVNAGMPSDYECKFYLTNPTQNTGTLDTSKLTKNDLYTNSLQLINFSFDSSILNKYNNKYVKFSDGTTKYIKWNYGIMSKTRTLTKTNALYTYLHSNLSSQLANVSTYSYSFNYNQGLWSLEIKDVAEGVYNISIDTNKKQLIDAPYKMFCMPYGIVDITVGTNKITSQPEINMAIAQALNTKYGETFIKDLQLLPYCPCREYIQADGSLIVSDKEINYATIKIGETNCGYMLFCQESSFSFNIFKEIIIQNAKLENECDLYRLTSPNGNGVFEFNLAKNGGLNFVNVDCTYMPFNPFIHLTPNFKNLYGADFDDYRGLICGGDFSLPKTTSAWETYQLNNKNYQAIFDRGITNLEINQNVQRTNEFVGILTSGVQSAISGAVGGAKIGGATGAIVGASISGAIGTGTSIYDYTQNEKLRQEAVAYQKDIFTLQNGNIKAQAQGIAKTIAFNINNKVFPVLEYYTCSDNEKEQVQNYFKYKAYTLNIIDKISNYNNYIEGTIIKTDIEDNAITEDINNELEKGIYLNGTI